VNGESVLSGKSSTLLRKVKSEMELLFFAPNENVSPQSSVFDSCTSYFNDSEDHNLLPIDKLA
jgi:hypothetical protein